MRTPSTDKISSPIFKRPYSEGKPFVIEVGPRSGGNFMSEIIRKHNGIDLIDAFIETFTNKKYEFSQQERNQRFVASYMIHSMENGVFKKIIIDEKLKPFIYDEILFINPGESIRRFSQGSDAIGNIKLEFPSKKIQISIMKSINGLIAIELI